MKPQGQATQIFVLAEFLLLLYLHPLLRCWMNGAGQWTKNRQRLVSFFFIRCNPHDDIAASRQGEVLDLCNVKKTASPMDFNFSVQPS